MKQGENLPEQNQGDWREGLNLQFPLPLAQQVRPEQYGHLIALGGEPIACTVWSLPDEDNLPANETMRMTEFIADALRKQTKTLP